MEIPHEKMMPGHLLEYRCPEFGIVWQWRVLGIYAGGERQEGLVEVTPVTFQPGTDSDGNHHNTMMVPEPMTRGMTVMAPGAGNDQPHTTTGRG